MKISVFLLESKAEKFAKLQFLSNKIDQNTNLLKYKVPNGYFCMNLHVIYNCSAFGSSHFCVSFSRGRKSKRIERNLKHKIRSLVDLCGFVSLLTKRFPILASKLCTHIFLTLWEIYPTLENVNSKREDSKVRHIPYFLI